MKNISRLAIVAVLLFLFSACAAVGILLPETPPPIVDWTYYGTNPPTKHIYTKEKIHKEWESKNEIPKINRNGNEETWTYRHSNYWCGALIVVVPLMLPVCSDLDIYHFKNDILVKHEYKKQKFYGVICSMMFPACTNGSNCTLCGIAR